MVIEIDSNAINTLVNIGVIFRFRYNFS